MVLAWLFLCRSVAVGWDAWESAFDGFYTLSIEAKAEIACDPNSASFSLLDERDQILYRAAVTVPGSVAMHFRKVPRYEPSTWYDATRITKVVADCSMRKDGMYTNAHAESAVHWGGSDAEVQLNLKKVDRSMEMPMPLDSDGDGFSDSADGCPTVKGDPLYYGCPAPVVGGDCGDRSVGARDFQPMTCWPKAGESVTLGADPVMSLSSAKRVWTSNDALPSIVWLNTTNAVGTYFTLYDRMGQSLPQKGNVGSGTMYVLDPTVAVVKSNIGFDFNRIFRDLTSDKLVVGKCPTGTIVTGTDTCQP